jgi:hypothetical protein
MLKDEMVGKAKLPFVLPVDERSLQNRRDFKHQDILFFGKGITVYKKLTVGYSRPFSKPQFVRFKKQTPSPQNSCVLLRN